MQFSPLPCYPALRRPKYSPQHPILKHPQPTFLPQCERPYFTTIQNNRQNCSSVYLNLCILDSNHHRISVMELGHLLTRSGLTYPEVSSKVCHDSFCQLGNSVSLPWVIYYGAFYLHVVSSFSYIPVICLILVLFLIPLQFVHLFCIRQQHARQKILYRMIASTCISRFRN